MTQTWHDLLFAHWPVDADALRALVPASLRARSLRRRRLARHRPLPHDQRHSAAGAGAAVGVGVPRAERPHLRDAWTGSRASSSSASTPETRSRSAPPARCSTCPYFSADDDGRQRDGRVDYASRAAVGAGRRSSRRATAARGDRDRRGRGTLEYFLTERYCLYAVDHASRAVPARHPPSAVAARVGRGGDRGEHDGRGRGGPRSRRWHRCCISRSGRTWCAGRRRDSR